MDESALPGRYCLYCGAENPAIPRRHAAQRRLATRCWKCLGSLEITTQDELTGATFFLNELPILRDSGIVSIGALDQLRNYFVSRVEGTSHTGPGPTQ